MRKCKKKTSDGVNAVKSCSTGRKKTVTDKPANADFACVPENLCVDPDRAEEEFLVSLEQSLINKISKKKRK